MATPNWAEWRNLIGNALGFDTEDGTNECGNEIAPGLSFGQIDGFGGQEDCDLVAREVGLAFGSKGATPPQPHLEERVEHWIGRVESWVLSSGVENAQQAQEIIRSYLNR